MRPFFSEELDSQPDPSAMKLPVTDESVLTSIKSRSVSETLDVASVLDVSA